MLGAADLPSGWKADPGWKNGSPLALFGSLCKDVNPNLSDTTVTGSWSSRTDNVAPTDAQIVEHVALVFAASRDARAMMARLVAPWANRCMAVGRPNGAMKIKTSDAFRPDVEVDQALGYHFAMTGSGTVPHVYADAVFLRVGSTVSMFIFLRDSKEPDTGLERDVMRQVAARMT